MTLPLKASFYLNIWLYNKFEIPSADNSFQNLIADIRNKICENYFDSLLLKLQFSYVHAYSIVDKLMTLRHYQHLSALIT